MHEVGSSIIARYVPAEQLVHTVVLVRDAYIPAGHGRHEIAHPDPFTSLNVPAGQLVQFVCPSSSWYVPVGQPSHGVILPMMSEAVPTAQRVQCGWPVSTLYEPAAHDVQLLADVAPAFGDAVPVGQGVHAYAPAASE